MPDQTPPIKSRFKPGQSGNPGGKHKLPEALRNEKALTKDEVARIIGKYSRMTQSQMLVASKDPAISRFDLAIISCIERAIEDGDVYRLEFLLSRTIGKVKEEHEVQMIKPFVIGHLSGEQTILGAKVIEGEVKK